MKGGAELELPPGFRFHPTDEELVNHYLCKRCAGQPIAVPIIAEIDLYKFDPWELPEMARYGEKEWYFFSPRDRKYPNGSRPNRSAGTGYWKATGADKPIGRPKTLAIKKSLVFYGGKAPKGTKTNWIMHEYRLANVDRSAGTKKNLRLDDWVLCRIYNKKGIIERHFPGDSELESYQEEEEEDVKVKIENYPIPNILTPGQSGTGYALTSDGSTYEKSVRNDSSSSGHVLSPGEEVVQSVPNWGNLGSGGGLDFGLGEFYSFEEDDPLDLLMMDDVSDAFFYPQNPF